MYNHIIHIDGIDRTGKDTLRKEIVKRTNGQYLVIVRSFISQIVYNRIYKRNINEVWFWDRFIHANNARDEKFFYLYCDKEIIEQRIKDTNEKDININQILEHFAVFNEVVEEAIEDWGIDIFKLNVTGMRVEHIFMQLQQRIINYEINMNNIFIQK